MPSVSSTTLQCPTSWQLYMPCRANNPMNLAEILQCAAWGIFNLQDDLECQQKGSIFNILPLNCRKLAESAFFFPNFIFIIKVASCCYPSTGNCCLEWFWQASLPRDDKAKFAAGLLVLWILESDDPKNHQEKVFFAVFSTHTLLTSAINTHFLWRSQMLDGKVSKKGASLAEKKIMLGNAANRTSLLSALP